MRVTDSSLLVQFLQGFRSTGRSVQDAIETLADGRRVRALSDDPSIGSVALALRAHAVRLQGLGRSGEAARVNLATIDSLLGEAFNLVVEARSEAMAAASGTRAAQAGVLADKIDSIREQLLALANRERAGRFLFAGTETRTLPFDPAGAYAGNGDETRAAIDVDSQVGVTLDGSEVFQGAGGDLFAQLDALTTALRAGDTAATEAAIAQLDGQLDHLADVRARVGTRMQRIDTTLARHDDELLRLETRIIELEGASPEETLVQLGEMQSRREALASTAARILGRSLFDFLG